MTFLTPEERRRDSFRSYEEAVREMRKAQIRKGNILPRDDDPEEIALHHEWLRERERLGH